MRGLAGVTATELVVVNTVVVVIVGVDDVQPMTKRRTKAAPTRLNLWSILRVLSAV